MLRAVCSAVAVAVAVPDALGDNTGEVSAVTPVRLQAHSSSIVTKRGAIRMR
jgi:hypothetical protein